MAIYSAFPHWQRWCVIVMSVCQRVTIINHDFPTINCYFPTINGCVTDSILCHIMWYCIWPWVKTYSTIFGWMNIHKSHLFWCSRGDQGFDVWPYHRETSHFQHIEPCPVDPMAPPSRWLQHCREQIVGMSVKYLQTDCDFPCWIIMFPSSSLWNFPWRSNISSIRWMVHEILHQLGWLKPYK